MLKPMCLTVVLVGLGMVVVVERKEVVGVVNAGVGEALLVISVLHE